MRNIHPLITLFSLLLALGCNQIVEIDLPEHKPQLVVNAGFTPDSIWKCRVTASQGIQVSTDPVAVTNATVTIWDNGVAIDTLLHASADTFLSIADRKPVAGHTYTIRASAPGFEDVSGTETVPMPVLPALVAWRDSAFIDPFGNVRAELTVAIDDPAGVHNRYLVSIFQVDTFILGVDTIYGSNSMYGESQDLELKFNYIANGFFIDDVNFDGRRREMKMQYYTSDHGGSGNTGIHYIVSTVTDSYYYYLTTLVDFYNANGNPFAEPVRMYSNMTPGMGIFAGYASVIGVLR
jgi:Domain of unknown function (DUF4249)